MNRFIKSIFLLLLTTAAPAILQGQGNTIKDTVYISGNCNMCKQIIEKAGQGKGVAKLEWKQETQTAQLVYNDQKTSRDEILQRIARAGYDNERYLASDEAYASLHHCCQYDRVLQKKKLRAAATKVQQKGS